MTGPGLNQDVLAVEVDHEPLAVLDASVLARVAGCSPSPPIAPPASC